VQLTEAWNRLAAYVDEQQDVEQQLRVLLDELLRTPDPDALRPLAHLFTRSRRHGQRGATFTFRAVARLLSQLSAAELADLRLTVAHASEDQSNERVGLAAYRIAPASAWLVQRSGDRTKSTPCSVGGDGQALLSILGSSGVAILATGGSYAGDANTLWPDVAIPRAALDLLADALGPEPDAPDGS